MAGMGFSGMLLRGSVFVLFTESSWLVGNVSGLGLRVKDHSLKMTEELDYALFKKLGTQTLEYICSMYGMFCDCCGEREWTLTCRRNIPERYVWDNDVGGYIEVPQKVNLRWLCSICVEKWLVADFVPFRHKRKQPWRGVDETAIEDEFVKKYKRG